MFIIYSKKKDTYIKALFQNIEAARNTLLNLNKSNLINDDYKIYKIIKMEVEEIED